MRARREEAGQLGPTIAPNFTIEQRSLPCPTRFSPPAMRPWAGFSRVRVPEGAAHPDPNLMSGPTNGQPSVLDDGHRQAEPVHGRGDAVQLPALRGCPERRDLR